MKPTPPRTLVCIVTALSLVVAWVAYLGPAAAAEPQVADTISLPGAQPLALAVYEGGNKIYVADDNSEALLVIDGATRTQIDSIDIGGSVFDVVVDESQGKVYAASNSDEASTSLTPGNGLISIIDADTDTILDQVDPDGSPDDGVGEAKYYTLAVDEVNDKVYFSYFCPFCGVLGEIDAATDAYSPIEYAADPTFNGAGIWRIEVNSVTNKVYVPRYGSNVVLEVDGTRTTSRRSTSTPAAPSASWISR